jgi:1-acyl-sn-glycerol-3-phosphate acyltransferase
MISITVPYFLYAWFFRVILFMLGWYSINPIVLRRLMRYDRSVLVFSHTSYTDFYILLVYLLAYPEELAPVRMLVKPEPFAYMGWLLRRIGALPATPVDSKQGGAVNRIVEELSKSSRWYFLISPKGTIVRRQWRSGYYHIAQYFNVPIMVAGLDYELKEIVVSNCIYPTISECEARKLLEHELSDIVPLYPEDEVVEVRQHNSARRTVVNWHRLLMIGLIGIMVWQM